ncbi:hypothetical protein [Herbidospora mongoliensis]|uniref:hypothetical protein n=1 Tax=Herbidospora mongoliensis TaxID=688067 RepID=UPI0008313824|nr:hypothetical protein [Herbidospora mongoliensis]
MAAVEAPPPDPDGVSTWPELTEKLRELHVWSGRPKYAVLSAHSNLAPSAISGVIGKNPLTRPPEATTLRFVEACLTYGKAPTKELHRWSAVWTRLSQQPESAQPVGAPPPRLRPRWHLPALAGAAAVAGAVIVAFAPALLTGAGTPAAMPTGGEAPAACSPDPERIEDLRRSLIWDGVFRCGNTPEISVYEHPRVGAIVGLLVTGDNWFVCWTRGERHQGGNDVWYYTQGDHSAAKKELEAWGFVPAVNLDTTTDPDPGVDRKCSFT